ncbi:hypothetical protein BS47DRAFT_1395554 [Hydnum rufescens UP504]|uniref:Mug135-like C-terminal domain-containing protein n=1 Tax=Hydnum rufescens UP504 TaxID=1448309 RepID=A0A9P6AU37_9AGAM|nr:hypothetical protein BS47DRAFT_1395554 [Hydnum rufescens UP504]
MPIQRLQRPRDHRIHVPRTPQDPPTLDDLARALEVKTKVLSSYQSTYHRKCTQDDVGRAMVYEHRLLNAMTIEENNGSRKLVLTVILYSFSQEALAPAWFAPVQVQLNAIQQQLAGIEEELLAVEEGLDNVAQSAGKCCAEATNALNDTGELVPWIIVPFSDGRNPTEEPFSLPALTSTSAIERLDVDTCNEYLEGYGVDILPGDGDLKERHRLLQDAIGCRVSRL